MAAQMDAAKDVPSRLAKTGELGLNREEVIKLLGGLFKSRVEVNLCKCIPSTCRATANSVHSFQRA